LYSFKDLEVHIGCVILTKAKIGGGETSGYTLFCQDVQEMFQVCDSPLQCDIYCHPCNKCFILPMHLA